MKAACIACVLVLVMSFAHAIDTGPAFEDPAQQERYERLIRELRCLVCRSESLADSNTELAQDLRRQVRELMTAGKADAEIQQYMVDRYGDYILYSPPWRGRTVMLWLAPAIFILIGIGVAVSIVRRKAKLPIDDSPEPGVS